MKPILEIQNISKKFRINHQEQAYLSLRDSFSNFFKRKSFDEDFWALQDVSFNVMHGDTVGIIGKNGAGKSTLLKILSKITPPTGGKIIGRGRIASLLEVGTGFHPELTGRENIFMNGSILGMRKKEILKNFDAIVDFAGVEKFIDTPLKHYSSGMQLRLAFAVSAFLQNEILIIDEVLAVGDLDFQAKCMDKMGDICKHGRTILFVSHNLDAIEELCKTSVFLSKGKVIEHGETKDIIKNYVSTNKAIDFKPVTLTEQITLQSFELPSTIQITKPVHFKFTIGFKNSQKPTISDLSLLIFNYKKQRVAIYDLRPFFNDFKYGIDRVEYESTINNFNLIEGIYFIGLYYTINGFQNDLFDLKKLEVKPKQNENKFKPYDTQYRGYVELI